MKRYVALFAACYLTAAHSTEQTKEVERFVASIQSAAQTKESIRQSLREIDGSCSAGSCVNTNATQICDVIGALDLRLGGEITARDRSRVGQPEIRVSGADLELFKAIWRQCRPTSYQYWNYSHVLHVWYEPEPGADAQIRRLLGLPISAAAVEEATPKRTQSTAAAMLAPLEPDAAMLDDYKGNNAVFNDLVRLVRARGYRCDSISAFRPFVMSRGFRMVCNRFAYAYEIEDKGGQWRVQVK